MYQDLKEVRDTDIGEVHAWQRKQQVQMPQGKNMHGTFQEKQNSSVSEAESGKMHGQRGNGEISYEVRRNIDVVIQSQKTRTTRQP